MTDLVNPLAENRLELTNMLQPGRLALPPPTGNLVVGRLVIRTRSQPSPMMTAVANAGPIINPGTRRRVPPGIRGDCSRGAAFASRWGRGNGDSAASSPIPTPG